MNKKRKPKGAKPIPVHERVLRRTHIPEDKTKCWLWQGAVNNAGYGMIKSDSGLKDIPKMMTVHRAVARFYCFPIDGVEVQHTCLNLTCVNPDHLVIGNAKSRSERVVKKHGKHFNKPKVSHKVCEHCGVKTYVIWFSRVHKDCYPGMRNNRYNNIVDNKV